MKKINILTVITIVIFLFVSCEKDETTNDVDTIAPPDVLNLTATPGEGRVLLEWDNPDDTDMVQIQISFTPATGVAQPIKIGPDEESYELINLEYETDYVFTVTTVDIFVNVSEGVVVSATTTAPEVVAPTTFTDERDGRIYNIVTIGDQVWMTENLAYLPEGSSLSNELDGAEDEGQSFKPFYYVPGFSGGNMEALQADPEAKAMFEKSGILYNWYAAMAVPETVTDTTSLEAYLNSNPEQGICPEGWRLPTAEDFQKLLDAVGKNDNNAGEVLKAITGWETGGTDDYGLALVPGGRRVDSDASGGVINNVDTYGYWWTSTLVDYTNNSLGLHPRITLRYASDAAIFKTTNYRASMGASIRCVRDVE